MFYLIVFFGAGIGGALRHAVNVAAHRLIGGVFPYGTFIVNVAGSFAMGALAGYFGTRPSVSQNVRLFLTTGILGGFTTYSAFTLDAALLVERHAYWLAAAYVAGSLAAGLVALFAGMSIFRFESNMA